MDTIKRAIGEPINVKASVDAVDRNTPVPIDGSLYAVSNYLDLLSKQGDREFYRRYLDHLKYFTSIFKFTGHEEIERRNMDIFRQLIEFGSVVVVNIKGRVVVGAVVHVSYNMYKDIDTITFIPAREGYGYSPDKKSMTVKADRCVFIKENFQALPFLFYWQDIIENMIKLRKSATTASIASIKKFKRNLQNNNSTISDAETASMMDPDTPFVDNVVSPASYLDEFTRAAVGDTRSDDAAYSTVPNAIDFNNLDSGARDLWDNLKSYMEFEYFQRGRRINTNKKNERNIAREIDTETINFDILEAELSANLKQAAKELSVLFDSAIEMISIPEEVNEKSLMLQNQGGIDRSENDTEEI